MKIINSLSLVRYKAILFMKAGPHSGNSLEKIIKMKMEELNRFGKFYWGYSGTLCHPYRVQRFVQANRDTQVMLILSPTKSAYKVENFKKIREYSIDNKKWKRLPQGIYLWNCKFAVVASNLKQVDQYINLNEYYVTTTQGSCLLGKYLRYRVNKACALFRETSSQPCLVKVSYIAELVYPFCIFLR
jgi:hypothetical protein